ncbi:uncharacterized protein HRG_11907 [Hirsutella rhossiliensis]|uniref:Uncharacterized protein n=1 Tax=Hirsutella rhossiliensis TaxID=111463 RepID=A0A9P8ML72_9HYPO|nr:uncharacterized protein HRG_11907 [Hirsutella rhossiliensis]KAH0957039.1 hypothetical protein HRG_11907 [Hirsutella rhossiliensis]
MDRLGIYFNNLTDTIVGRTTLPVIRKWGHPWFLLPKTNEAAIAFLTESEIRTFIVDSGTQRSQDFTTSYGKLATTIRFKFTLKDDQEFNYEIVADVLYLNPSTPRLARGTNFASLEFRNEVERYHAPLRPINDTAGPNGIVPTLLVFGASPRMASAERQVQGALHTKNGPSSTGVILSLPLQSETFRSTLVQPYFRDETTIPAPLLLLRMILTFLFLILRAILFLFLPLPCPLFLLLIPGAAQARPPWSKNKPKTTFLVKKEEDAYQPAIKLRDEGIITTPGTL